MKKIFSVLVIITMMFSSFAREKRDISDERAIILLNYLQYSLAQIQENPNKIVAQHEFDTIINGINRSSLKDPDIIQAYDNMLTVLTQIRLIDEQKEHAEQLAAIERKNAIFNIFRSAGSIFVPGRNPLISLAYVGISAGLNYAGAKAQAKVKKFETDFQISRDLLIDINDARKNLYISGAKVFASRDDTDRLITESRMSDFVSAVNESDSKRKLNKLSRLDKSMEYFPPYWYALGFAQHENGLYDRAFESYKKYDAVLGNEMMILEFDDIYCQVYQSLIDIYAVKGKERYRKEIYDCITKLERQVGIAPLSEMDRLTYSIACAYQLIGECDKAFEKLDELDEFADDSWKVSSNELRKAINREHENHYWIGIEAISKNNKVVVDKVSSNSTLQAKDVILAINNKPVDTLPEMDHILAHLSLGDKCNVKILRNGNEMVVNSVVQEKRSTNATGTGEGWVGFTARVDKRKLVVKEVEDASPAYAAGLEVGDWLKEINGVELKSNYDIKRIIDNNPIGTVLEFNVIRDDEPLSLFVEIGEYEEY